MGAVFANPKNLIRFVGSAVAFYDAYAIWSLGQMNALLGAGIVGAFAGLALMWLSPRVSVELAGLALAGGILAVLLGLAPTLVGPLIVLASIPLVVAEAQRDEDEFTRR